MLKAFLKIFFVLLVIGFLVFIYEKFIIVNPEIDACLDSGICTEGLSLNTENGSIIVNEQTCIENDGKWIEERKVCSFYYH